jgi:hypothetical protein
VILLDAVRINEAVMRREADLKLAVALGTKSMHDLGTRDVAGASSQMASLMAYAFRLRSIER